MKQRFVKEHCACVLYRLPLLSQSTWWNLGSVFFTIVRPYNTQHTSEVLAINGQNLSCRGKWAHLVAGQGGAWLLFICFQIPNWQRILMNYWFVSFFSPAAVRQVYSTALQSLGGICVGCLGGASLEMNSLTSCTIFKTRIKRNSFPSFFFPKCG